jgi:hypothetical protein
MNISRILSDLIFCLVDGVSRYIENAVFIYQSIRPQIQEDRNFDIAMKFRIIFFLDFIHRPEFYIPEDTMIRKLDLFPKNCVFWDVKPCGSCKNRRFGGT